MTSDNKLIHFDPEIQGMAQGQTPLGGLKSILIDTKMQCRWISQKEKAFLTFSVACDIRNVCIFTLNIHGRECILDASFASHAQKLRISVYPGEESFTIATKKGEGELWIGMEKPLNPTISTIGNAKNSRRDLMKSKLRYESLAQFSWMGGCLLDGFNMLDKADPQGGWIDVIKNWTSYFIDHEGNLTYQSPRGMTVVNSFINIEATLPVAILIRIPAYQHLGCYALHLWRAKATKGGAICDENVISAEGCYTVAYPMAAMAAEMNDKKLNEQAKNQLRIRSFLLKKNENVYLRSIDGDLTFCNWARGICWYLLGNVRCLSFWINGESEKVDDIKSDFIQIAASIIKKQRKDGLWDNFLDEKGFPPDSSGSAGIAAALAEGYRLGLLDVEALQSARDCYKGLQNFLEADGWLGGAAPNNKRGELTQHTSLRTTEPFALGLYAQLWGSLSLIDNTL